MPYLFVYSPSDFITTPAAEQGAKAAGKGTFELELKPGATGTRVFIDDDDAIFDEVDSGQTVGATINLDGMALEAGTSVHSAYDLINSATGHQVTSLHFGGDGYQQGAVDGIISTERLDAGKVYTFDVERTSHRKDNQYENYVSCFASGARIATPTGPRAVERLVPGDLVLTVDDGPQPILWAGRRTVRGDGPFAPVHLSRGVLGLRQPLLVSPQHRMMAQGQRLELMFGIDSAFVAAKHLCDGATVWIAPQRQITYHHILFERHQAIWANGAVTESFLPDITGVAGLAHAGQAELFALFPEVFLRGAQAPVVAAPARPILKRFETVAWRRSGSLLPLVKKFDQSCLR